MNRPFCLGFLTRLEGAEEPRRIYQETLDLFVAADPLGFDVVGVAQHHFKEHGGCLPSPLPFLAGVAERTRRLRLGTSIVILPLEHPLRVAEDAAVVDFTDLPSYPNNVERNGVCLLRRNGLHKA